MAVVSRHLKVSRCLRKVDLDAHSLTEAKSILELGGSVAAARRQPEIIGSFSVTSRDTKTKVKVNSVSARRLGIPTVGEFLDAIGSNGNRD
jgi:hypothetical protein